MARFIIMLKIYCSNIDSISVLSKTSSLINSYLIEFFDLILSLFKFNLYALSVTSYYVIKFDNMNIFI